jgi:preprotein translocase subunit SecF
MFPRTIITSFTVFIVVALIYFFGEGEFQNFGFAMIIGVVTGVYSTLSIACPLYIWIKENEELFKKFAK